ncbi:MAG: thioredoxin [Chloroflexi bacterium]|nr:thioredoxin [Chloroflexota bacterium]
MAKTRFDVEKHPVLVGWHNGESIKRRARPWASDVVGFADVLKTLAPAPANPTNPNGNVSKTEESKKELKVINKPVHVTDATFEQEVLQSELPVLVDFWAAWCGPCRMVAPILEKLAGEFAGKVKIAKVDVDANPSLSSAFQIMSIPTLMFVKQGKIVGQAAGAAPEAALRDALNQLVNLQIPA